MKFTALLLAAFVSAAVSQQTDEEIKKNCDLFQGKLEKVHLTYLNQDVNSPATKNLCITSFGTDSAPITLDADFLGPNMRSVANSVLTQINLINFPKVLEAKGGDPNPTYWCNLILSAAQASGVRPAFSWTTDDGKDYRLCMLQDGSVVDPNNLMDASMSNLSKDRNSTIYQTYALAKERIPEPMRLYMFQFNPDYVIDPVEFQQCKVDSDCTQNTYDPCTEKVTKSKFVCQEGLCAVEGARCNSNSQCTGTSVRRSYGYANGDFDHSADNVGFCVPQSCQNKRCVADGMFPILD